jgi:hypothetical protein
VCIRNNNLPIFKLYYISDTLKRCAACVLRLTKSARGRGLAELLTVEQQNITHTHDIIYNTTSPSTTPLLAISPHFTSIQNRHVARHPLRRQTTSPGSTFLFTWTQTAPQCSLCKRTNTMASQQHTEAPASNEFLVSAPFCRTRALVRMPAAHRTARASCPPFHDSMNRLQCPACVAITLNDTDVHCARLFASCNSFRIQCTRTCSLPSRRAPCSRYDANVHTLAHTQRLLIVSTFSRAASVHTNAHTHSHTHNER